MPKKSLHMECRRMKKILSSAMESDMGEQFTYFQTGGYLWIIMIDMGQPQPDAPVAIGNL